MACASFGVGSRDGPLSIDNSGAGNSVVGWLKKEEKDVFWPEFVPCGCRLASDLTDTEAGAPIVVVQTLKSLSEKQWQHQDWMKSRNSKNL